MEESARFDRMQRDWGEAARNPDDVFFEASDQKQGIKEQIRGLHKALGTPAPATEIKKEKATR